MRAGKMVLYNSVLDMNSVYLPCLIIPGPTGLVRRNKIRSIVIIIHLKKAIYFSSELMVIIANTLGRHLPVAFPRAFLHGFLVVIDCLMTIRFFPGKT